MARKETPDGSPSMIVTSITVVDLPGTGGRSLGPRVSARVAAALAAALAVVVAIVIVLPGGGTSERAGQGERAAIARALGYAYPLQCLAVAVSAATPDYATASIDPANGCGRYRGYVNASLHRVAGTWRLVLDEGQLFVPNRLLGPAGSAGAGAADYRTGCLSAQNLAQVPGFARAGSDRQVCARPGSS